MIKNIIGNVQTENKTDADYWTRPAVTEKEFPSSIASLNAQPSTLNRSSNGKIARLPADLRDSVNQWITDAMPFDTISARLAALGHPGISHQNISNWKANGHQKWLHHQEQIDDQRTRYEMACQMARDLGHSDDSTRACTMLITTRLFELLLASADETDPETARKNNLQICQLSRALSVYLGESARNNRLQFDKQRHQEKIAAITELARSKVFHSEDNAINTLNQMLGLKPRSIARLPGVPFVSVHERPHNTPDPTIQQSSDPTIHPSPVVSPRSLGKPTQGDASQNTIPHRSTLNPQP